MTKPRYYAHGFTPTAPHPFEHHSTVPTVMDRDDGDVLAHAASPATARHIVAALNAYQEAGDGSGGTEPSTEGSPAPTEAGNLPSLVHQARNILWSADNGGHNGRPSEVKRILAAICDESERLHGAL